MTTARLRAGFKATRVDPVLVIAAALAFGAAGAVASEATALAAIVCAALMSPRLSSLALGAATLALALGWGRAISALQRFDADYERARQVTGGSSRCALRGRVQSSPTQRKGSSVFDVELDELDCEGTRDAGQRRVRLYGTELELGRGDVVSAIAELGPIGMFHNFDLPNPRPSAARRGAVLSGSVLTLEVESRSRGLPAAIDRARSHVRRRIEATFSLRVRGMARALVLGENDLDESDALAFRKSGLSHLLAVSGTHLIFAVLSVVSALRAVLLRVEALSARCDVQRAAAALGLILAPAYADFAGGSGSAWRAAYMLIAVLGVRVLGRHVYPSRIIAASLVLGWLEDGLCIFDPSFLLSLAATVGLLCMTGELEERSLAKAAELIELTAPAAPTLVQLANRASRAALTTLAATLPCVPVLLVISPGMTLASVGANLLAGPLGEVVALPLCLAHAVLAPFPDLERGVAIVASGALAVIRALAHASASVEWLYVELPPPERGHFVTFAIAAAGWAAAGGQRWLEPQRRCSGASSRARWVWLLACAVAALAVEAVVRHEHSADGARLGRLRVTVLDVGQGDAALVDLPDGRLMLVDAGGFVGSSLDPGELVVVPTLRARRRSKIDIAVLTHPHPDHFGGLSSVAEQLHIVELWYGGGRERASPDATPGSLGALFAKLEGRGVRLRHARELCGDSAGKSAPGLSVLLPCPDLVAGQSANDNSIVLQLTHGRESALLLGDAEHWAEHRLLELHSGKLRASLLKVGHHGSRSSTTPELIAEVRPSVAAISCGARNRFGHPHVETLQTLARFGVSARRVDMDGAFQWETDGVDAAYRVWAGGD